MWNPIKIVRSKFASITSRIMDSLKMKTIKLWYIASAILFIGIGLYCAIAFPSIPVLGKFSSIIFASLGCLIGGIILGKLSIKSAQYLEKVIIEKNEKIKEKEKDQEREIDQLKQEQFKKLREIDELKSQINNLRNSVICSFQMFPVCELSLLKAQYKVQKYLTKTLDHFDKKMTHRAWDMEYRAVFSQDISQKWYVDLNKLLFKINTNDKKIEIYNTLPHIQPSYEQESWPMEGQVFAKKYNKDNENIVDEMEWLPEYDVKYKNEVDQFKREEIAALHNSFENAASSDDELTKNLTAFAQQQLQVFFEKIFGIMGNFGCEIRTGEAPLDAINFDALNVELNIRRLMNTGLDKDEAKQFLMNKGCSRE